LYRIGVTERRHVVWDWNGTLLDDFRLVIAATNVTFASAGGPEVTPEHHRRYFRRPIADYYAQVLRRPVSRDEFDRLDKVFHDAYQAALPGCGLAPDALAALRGWPGTQSLLSMWHHAELVPLVDRYGLTGHFTRIDGLREGPPGTVEHKGPHLAEHLAAQRLAPADVVLIGDTADDAHAAAAVGATCVLYSGGFTDAAVLRATGGPVTDSLLAALHLARTN
jgi:phosphoglycolate phosphatase-like HAD superfamily hydrolase